MLRFDSNCAISTDGFSTGSIKGGSADTGDHSMDSSNTLLAVLNWPWHLANLLFNERTLLSLTSGEETRLKMALASNWQVSLLPSLGSKASSVFRICFAASLK